MRKVLLLSFLLLLGASGAQGQSNQTSDLTREEYEVYSVVISRLQEWHQVKLLVIANPTRCPRSDTSMDNIQFRPSERPSSLSRETFEDYLACAKEAKSLTRSFNLKTNYVLVDYGEIERLINLTNPAKAFDDFYLKYPESGGFITLSRVGFNRNHDQALVSTGWLCGALCGMGAYVLLTKKSGAWSVEKTAEGWVA